MKFKFDWDYSPAIAVCLLLVLPFVMATSGCKKKEDYPPPPIPQQSNYQQPQQQGGQQPTTIKNMKAIGSDGKEVEYSEYVVDGVTYIMFHTSNPIMPKPR